MEVTDRPLLALVPVLAAALAVVVVAILQGGDAIAIALPVEDSHEADVDRLIELSQAVERTRTPVS